MQPAEGRLRDADIIELEPLQHREGGINLGQIAAADAGGAQPGSEAERGWRQGQRAQRQQARQIAVAVELELLEAIEDGGPEPAVEFGVAVAAEADGFEGEAADGAAVRGDDLAGGSSDSGSSRLGFWDEEAAATSSMAFAPAAGGSSRLRFSDATAAASSMVAAVAKKIKID